MKPNFPSDEDDFPDVPDEDWKDFVEDEPQ